MNENKVVKGDLKQEIFNTVNENVRALEAIFPSAVKDGQVDFEALKEELGQFEEVGPEKYGLTWTGKQNAKKIAQQDIIGKTLKFVPEESKDIETTENLYIEGDNLEVLKLLRQNYYGAIKMIYIDPPYNTGNDFIYKDQHKIAKDISDMQEGDSSEDGEKYILNQSSTNRYHTNWLNMIYPRLKISKELLRNDGVIFLSIDDNEIDNLKKICNEVFGEKNFLGCFIVNTTPNARDYGHIGKMHEYVLFYAKNQELVETKLLPDEDKKFKYMDEISGFNIHPLYNSNVAFTNLNRPNLYYPFYVNSNSIINNEFFEISLENKEGFVEVWPPKSVKDNVQFVWRWGKDKAKVNLNKEIVGYKVDGEYRIVQKMRHSEKLIRSIISTKGVTSRRGTAEVEEIFGKKLFSFPKPIELIYMLSYISTEKDDIILDFFSGSATTAHAVMKLNVEDGKKRKFIMVQLPEQINGESEAYNLGYKTICDIGKERIRRCGAIFDNIDTGFKVFRVGSTNIRWDYEDIKAQRRNMIQKETQLEIAATQHNNVEQIDLVTSMMSDKDQLDFMPGTKDIDVVYELLLRQRDIPLSAKIELLSEIGERTYLFAQSYLVCLETEITNELIEKIAAINPLPIKFIFRDSAFEDDINLKDETIRRFRALVARNTGEQQKAYTVEFI